MGYARIGVRIHHHHQRRPLAFLTTPFQLELRHRLAFWILGPVMIPWDSSTGLGAHAGVDARGEGHQTSMSLARCQKKGPRISWLIGLPLIRNPPQPAPTHSLQHSRHPGPSLPCRSLSRVKQQRLCRTDQRPAAAGAPCLLALEPNDPGST